MSNFIATYFYQEPENFNSEYANIKENKNETYWDTILLFFITSTYINKNVVHCFFTNVSIFPWRHELESMGVKIYDNINNTNLAEGKWASVKYFFDVINYINYNSIFPSESYYCLFDTDCIAVNPFDFSSLTRNNYAYISGVEKNQNYDFHGKTLKKLSEYHGNIFGNKPVEIIEKIGGEFYCFKKTTSNQCLSQYEKIINSKYNKELRTEEQILSMVNSTVPFSKKEEHIKRVWTTIKNFNLKKSDFADFSFLHLPAEKNYMTKILLKKYYKNEDLTRNYCETTILSKPLLLRLLKIKNKVFK